jgi:hypothetical protein
VSSKERFLSRVAIAPDHATCWEWTGSVGHNGYGRFRFGRRIVRAHRCSYELFVGAIPDGLQVLHSCDNRRCVRPSHLFLGTNEDNVADRCRKGRSGKSAPHLRGEGNGRSKLTAAAVLQIDAACRSTRTQVSVAREFGVSGQTVNCIMRQRAWRHVFS